MGCICSKATDVNDHVAKHEEERENERSKSSTQLIAPEEVTLKSKEGSRHLKSSISSSTRLEDIEHNPKDKIIEHNPKDKIIDRPANGHRRNVTLDSMGSNRMTSMPHGTKGEQAAAGWPPWLSSVAGEAIKGWLPRNADSYEKLKKIGQGTYSSVYKARDLKSDKIVAMKKVRFVQMDPESVRFMAREIGILRRLDHPNVMKLEALAISKVSGSFYLVFEYMEHDLAGLIATQVKFTEPQIKCYMQQILLGLEHCHSRGILHRDLKGANILVDSKGNLKIADFGLATIIDPSKKQLLTSRVVTLWYRAPELLLGATKYGSAIDLWSVGCILAEMFTRKPIMPGRTEVEQMHKIFKLCGSPTEEFWKKTKLPLASSFRSQHIYKRCISETFKDLPSSTLALLKVLLSIDPQDRGTASSALKSGFFTTKPLPCDPSKLPRYPSSKELEVKIRDEVAMRQRNESVRGEDENASKNSSKMMVIPEEQGQQNTAINSNGFPIVPPRVSNDCTHQSKSVIHPTAVKYTWNKERNNDLDDSVHGSYQHSVGLTRQGNELRQPIVDSSDIHPKDVRRASNDTTGHMARRNRILYSGPLFPPGGNMDDMLKEHERQIQAAVRKAKLDKVRSNLNV